MSERLYSVYKYTKNPIYRLVIAEGSPIPSEAVREEWTFAAAVTESEVGEYGFNAIAEKGYWLYKLNITFQELMSDPPMS